jgi:hypothetical protein
MLSHLSGHMSDDQVATVELHAKSSVGQRLRDHSFDFERFFLRFLRHTQLRQKTKICQY